MHFRVLSRMGKFWGVAKISNIFGGMPMGVNTVDAGSKPTCRSLLVHLNT